jgi:hypothetical protein
MDEDHDVEDHQREEDGPSGMEQGQDSGHEPDLNGSTSQRVILASLERAANAEVTHYTGRGEGEVVGVSGPGDR